MFLSYLYDCNNFNPMSRQRKAHSSFDERETTFMEDL